MDGNGRWAELRGKKRTFGHEEGAKSVKEITAFCAKHSEIKRVTLYAFSTENWARPRLEVEYLMRLLEKYLSSELNTYLEHNIRFESIGDIRAFSNSLQETIRSVEEQTAKCDALVQSLALNYGSKDEILRTFNTLKHIEGKITEEMMLNSLDCKESVDMLIRTGGEKRLSNFLLWQSAYAELFFSDTLWPDFTSSELEEMISSYKERERRFGGA